MEDLRFNRVRPSGLRIYRLKSDGNGLQPITFYLLQRIILWSAPAKGDGIWMRKVPNLNILSC